MSRLEYLAELCAALATVTREFRPTSFTPVLDIKQKGRKPLGCDQPYLKFQLIALHMYIDPEAKVSGLIMLPSSLAKVVLLKVALCPPSPSLSNAVIFFMRFSGIHAI
jgi:hypothetical protein